MSFFDVPPPPEPPEPDPHRNQPEWAGPPPGMLPGISTQRVVLFHTDRAFLAADRFLVYPNGLEFSLSLRVRHPDDHDLDLPWERPGRRRPTPPPDDFLRIGVLLSDGRKWTNLDWRHLTPEPGAQNLVILGRGGGGGGDAWRISYWMWPLPPPGHLTVVTEWPAFGVPETSASVDADELRARADDADLIWPG